MFIVVQDLNDKTDSLSSHRSNSWDKPFETLFIITQAYHHQNLDECIFHFADGFCE